MADIDDLSDTEKVSLISDVELRDSALSDGADPQKAKQAPGGKRSKSQKKQRDLLVDSRPSLNLKNLKELAKESQPFAVRVHNGIKITK